MRWVTLSFIHVDRVAALWLIRRFIDGDATFEYADWGDDDAPPAPGAVRVAQDAIPVGIPGVELGMHDTDGLCFAKVLRKYDLQDPGLWGVEAIVAAAVSVALSLPARRDETDEQHSLGVALNSLGTAYSVLGDDDQHLERALPLYDALYAHCLIRRLPSDLLANKPLTPPRSVPFLREAIEIGMERSTR